MIGPCCCHYACPTPQMETKIQRGIPIELPRQLFLTGLNFGEQISFGKASSPNPLPPIREGYLDQFYLEWASGLSEPLPDFSVIVF